MQINRDILRRMVLRWGMTATVAASGDAALTAAATAVTEGNPFDVILLDMQMPGMDGVEVAERMRADLASPPAILILTSINRDGGLRERTLEAGALDILYKPTKPAQLHAALLRAFGAPPSVDDRTAWVSRPAESTSAPRRPLRILLAEDNLVNQKVAARTLMRLGYTADIVANGLEALDALHRQRYDVVLMDIQMPEMDGFEATGRIRTDWPPERQPFIIALTANAMDGDRERCLDAGCDAYLPKPLDRGDLAGLLAAAPRPMASVSE